MSANQTIFLPLVCVCKISFCAYSIAYTFSESVKTLIFFCRVHISYEILAKVILRLPVGCGAYT